MIIQIEGIESPVEVSDDFKNLSHGDQQNTLSQIRSQVITSREPPLASEVPSEDEPFEWKAPLEDKTWKSAFGEMARLDKEYLPYVNLLEIADSGKAFMAAQRLKKGTASNEDKQYINLCKALGREDLAVDERFVSLNVRLTNIDLMIELIDAEFSQRPWRETLDTLHENDVPFAPVYNLEDFMEDPQVKHNRTVFDAEDPRGGTTRFVRHPGVYEKTPATLRRHPPRYGEHTGEILTEAGYTDEEIAALRTAQAIA